MRDVSEAIDLLLSSGEPPGKLLALFGAFAEGAEAAFADAARTVAVSGSDRPGIQARGSVRRWLLDRAFRAAAQRAGYPVGTDWTTPPSWNFPVVRAGAFSLTLGVVDRRDYGHALRSRGEYVRRLARRNGALNRQYSLWAASSTVRSVTPPGAFGALLVVEYSAKQPDSPLHVGFFVPSPTLKSSYLSVRLDSMVAELKGRVAPAKPVRRKPERKKPIVRRRPKEQD